MLKKLKIMAHGVKYIALNMSDILQAHDEKLKLINEAKVIRSSENLADIDNMGIRELVFFIERKKNSSEYIHMFQKQRDLAREVCKNLADDALFGMLNAEPVTLVDHQTKPPLMESNSGYFGVYLKQLEKLKQDGNKFKIDPLGDS